LLLVLDGTARAQADHPLGQLERESVNDALSGLGLQLEAVPAGKVIGTVYIVNQDVFSRRDWYFQWFNLFHRTTRPEILRRELLFSPGQPYDQSLIDETIRNLQAAASVRLATGLTLPVPELSSVVAMLPIAARTPGKVDVLVVTRDVWSLRFNTDFNFQQNVLSSLDTSLSENNLFGWRKYFSVGFSLDLGKYAIGPTYFDPNIAGTRLQLYANALAFYTRGSNSYEGNTESFTVLYPLYSLASKWGAALNLAHEDAVLREFQGTGLALLPLGSDPTKLLPDIFRRRYGIVDASVTRSFGLTVIQRASLGYRFDDRRSSPFEDRSVYGNATEAQIQEFVGERAPITEQRSEPYLGYDLFTAWYAIYRDLDTFDLRENQRLGPAVSLRAAYGAPELGADFRAFPLSGAASWAVGPRGSFASASVVAGLRVRDGNAIDQSVQGKIYFASPVIRRLARVVLSAEADAVRSDTRRTLYFLGGDTGLRGYIIGELHGTSELVGHAELRSLPLPVWSQRFGAVLFCDVGGAAPSFAEVAHWDGVNPGNGLHTDLGVGLRWLIPQLNSTVIRVDWAVPLADGPETRWGLPGRFTAGFLQYF
jgi:outer membrane protein assembly factor BamA